MKALNSNSSFVRSKNSILRQYFSSGNISWWKGKRKKIGTNKMLVINEYAINLPASVWEYFFTVDRQHSAGGRWVPHPLLLSRPPPPGPPTTAWWIKLPHPYDNEMEGKTNSHIKHHLVIFQVFSFLFLSPWWAVGTYPTMDGKWKYQLTNHGCCQQYRATHKVAKILSLFKYYLFEFMLFSWMTEWMNANLGSVN